MENDDKNPEIICKIFSHCQKITEALYRITELFPSKEPLKWILREECLKIFRLFISLKDSSLHKKINSFEKIFERTDRMISLLDIAAANSFITNINFNVLKREYLNLKNFLDVNKTLCLSVNEVNFDKLFAISESNGHDNGHNNYESEIKHNLMSVMPNTMSDKFDLEKRNNNVLNKYNNRIDRINMSDSFHNKSDITDKNDEFNGINMANRAGQILQIINSKPGKDITLNEACLYFKNISQKTIQRELAKLVYEGVLRAEGEKRWRKYIII